MRQRIDRVDGLDLFAEDSWRSVYAMPKVKSVFLDFVRLVVNGDIDEVSRRLAASPSLATVPAEVGAVRNGAHKAATSEWIRALLIGGSG